MSPYVGPNESFRRTYHPNSYFYSHANDSSSSDGSSVFSPQSTPLSVSSASSGSRSSSGSSPPSTPPQRTQSPQRRVGFSPSPVTGELRPPTSEEILALHCFESHARACPICLSPTQAQQKNCTLCIEGRSLAEEVSNFFYRRDGIIYSTNSDPYKLVHIEFPFDARRCLKLLKAMESDRYKKPKGRKQCRHRRSSPYQEHLQNHSPAFNTGDEIYNKSSPIQIPTGLQPPFNIEKRRPSPKTQAQWFNADEENQHPQQTAHHEYQSRLQPHHYSRHQHHYPQQYQPYNLQSESSPSPRLSSTKRVSLMSPGEHEYRMPSKHQQSVFVKNGRFIVNWPDQSETENFAEYDDVTGLEIRSSGNDIRGAYDSITDSGNIGTRHSSRRGSQDYGGSNYSYYRRSLYDDDLVGSSRAQRRYKTELREPRESREQSRANRKSRYYVQRRPISSYFF